jgi:DNA-binding IclR family transcriptional regulator
MRFGRGVRSLGAARTPAPVASAPAMKLNQSVQKALAILRAAAVEPAGASAAGLARAAGLPNSTALRLIHTLEHEGFLTRRGDGRFAIGHGVLGLAREAEPGMLLDAGAPAALEALARATRETVTLSLVRGHDALDVVLQIDAPHMVKADSWVGRRYPLHASSSGKVLLASLPPARRERLLRGTLERFTEATITDPALLERELERVRARGYAEIVDELEPGLASTSVPIQDEQGRLLATVNVTGPSFRYDAARRAAGLAPMRAAVGAVEERLRGVLARELA